MFFTIVAIFVFLYSINNFKRGFTIYMVFEILYCPNAKVADLSGMPSIPIYLCLSLAFAILYFLKYRRVYYCKERFPLAIPLSIMLVSRFASCFTSLGGFTDELARSIGFLFNGVIEVWIIWQTFDTEEDYRKLLKYFCYAFLFVGLYGCYEYVNGINPIFEYKKSLLESLQAYKIDSFRGYRLMSIFEHPIGAGMNCATMIVFYFLARFKYTSLCDQRYLGIIVCLLCLSCIFLTKMRAGILFLVIGCLSFINFRASSTIKFLLLTIVLAFFALPLLGEYANVFYSLFDSDAANEVGGSNADMRMEQLSASVYFMLKSPIAGFGDQALAYLTDGRASELLALESVYFEEMVKHGCLGLLGVFVSIYYSIWKLPRQYASSSLFFLSLSYWLTYSLTSIPSFRMNMYYILMFCCIKMSEIYQKKNTKI